MTIRGSHLILAGAGLAALALCIGTVAAKPGGQEQSSQGLPSQKKAKGMQGLDPGLAKQLAPRFVKKEELLELQKRSIPEVFVPQFNVRRVDPLALAKILGVGEPGALPGPRRFDARTHYHDDSTYMEVLGYGGASVGIRPLRNYLHFIGSPEVMASRFTRPSVIIHFKALANTRYLLECAVDAQAASNFFASDARSEYSVTTADKTTLLYMRDQGGIDEDVAVQVSSDGQAWYLDGCELTPSRS